MENATNRVLDRLAAQDKASGGTGTDYKLAQLLETSPQLISRYRRGLDQMGAPVAIRAADLLGVEPLRLIGEISMERARDEREKKFWQRTVKGAGGKVAALVTAVMMTAFAGMPTPARADFPFPNAPSSAFSRDDLYNARNSRRRRRWWWVLWHPITDLSNLTGTAGPAPALA